jgi:hypothetical protein
MPPNVLTRAARPVRGQLSRLSWVRAPASGCFGIVIAGCPATASLRVP